MYKKYDNIISTALKNNKAYDSYFNIIQSLFAFHFFTTKQRDLHCSHEIMLRTKLTHTYTYYIFIQHHYMFNTSARNPQHRLTFIKSKYTSSYFVNFIFCIKNTNIHRILQNYDPIRQTYIFCPLTISLDFKKSCPLIIPHEYKQPNEVHNLEYSHKTKHNHKLYNLIENTYEFLLNHEEHNVIRSTRAAMASHSD